jgi:hypothetical protein
MIPDHALRELLDCPAGSFLRRKLAELHLGQSASRGGVDEGSIGLINLALRRSAGG